MELALRIRWRTFSSELNIPYKTIPGEAAFYGPKIDVKLVDAIGRLWQLSTVQFDFNLPQRFEPGVRRRGWIGNQPVMVHRALYRFGGAIFRRADRALCRSVSGVALAGAGGDDPDHRAPRRVRATRLQMQLKAVGVRVHVDARNEKMNAKIREHAMQKVPFLLVVGDKEAEAGKVNVRTRGKEKTEDMPAAEFVEKIKGLIEQKSASL